MTKRTLLAVFLLAGSLGLAAGGLPLSDEAATAKARAVAAKLSLDQKVSLLGGCATMYLNAIPAAGIPREWAMSDCSHAVKPEHGRWDWPYVEGVDDRSVPLPPLSAVAMSWDRDLAAVHGHVMAEQMRALGKDQILGPGVNINRNPLCGRNWEYMSEDPFLNSELVVPYIRAVQSHGVAATVKHFCVNNQELNRVAVDTVVDERTLHEIYLPAFAAAIRRGGALSVMSAYNKYNGQFCSENSYLLRGILRDRFGFQGMITTDWGGQHSTVPAALNGGNVEMDRGKSIVHFTDHLHGKLPLADAVRRGDVPEATVDEMVLHVLWTMAKTGFLDGLQDKGERLTEKHHRLCREIGEESVVLLKNEAGVLPLVRGELRKVVVVGLNADRPITHLGSSCEAHPEYEITAFAGLREYLPAETKLTLLPLGDEAATADRPQPIPEAVLETFMKDGGEAFAKRAWERYEWPAGTRVWVDKPVLTGYVPYPVGWTNAQKAVRYVARVRASESGEYIFGVEKGAAADGITILVDGRRAYNFTDWGATAEKLTLERGRVYEVTVDVGGSKGEFRFGWQPPSARAVTKDSKRAELESADAVIVFTGTQIGGGRAMENEGYDLPSMAEPAGHDEEIAEILGMKIKRLVVVHRSATQMEMPWADRTATLLQLPYLGQEGGRAFARVLFGDVNPSGKLVATWPKRFADTAVAQKGTYTAEKSVYNERFYVGYRWFDEQGIEPLFPFGYGKSYTTFAYSDFKVRPVEGGWEASVTVRNTGRVAGREVVQLYVEPTEHKVERVKKELKGFAKTSLLAPGASETVRLRLSPRDLAFYDVFRHRWHALPGDYRLLVGASSADILAREVIAFDRDVVFDIDHE